MTSSGPILQTIKPSSANYWKGTVASAVLFVPLIALQFILNPERATLSLILVIVVPVCLLAIALFFVRARIFITATHVGKQGILRTRWTALAEFDRALLVRGYTAPAEQPRTELFMFTASGHKLLRLFGRFWAEPDMIALVEATGATLGLMEGLVKPRDVVRVEPKALRWIEVHPWLASWAAIVALVVLVILIAVVLSLIS